MERRGNRCEAEGECLTKWATGTHTLSLQTSGGAIYHAVVGQERKEGGNLPSLINRLSIQARGVFDDLNQKTGGNIVPREEKGKREVGKESGPKSGTVRT